MQAIAHDPERRQGWRAEAGLVQRAGLRSTGAVDAFVAGGRLTFVHGPVAEPLGSLDPAGRPAAPTAMRRLARRPGRHHRDGHARA